MSRHRLARTFAPGAIRALLLVASAATVAAASGCARPVPVERVPRSTILVMDFAVPTGVRENPREVRGWWFGARTIHQNPRAGRLMAERLTARLAPEPYANLFSRLELKYYFARKKQNLKAAYEHLTDAQLDELVSAVDPLEFARELGADKILSGRIVRSYMSEHRTFHFFSSVLEVEVELIDALSGRVEWTRRYRDRRWLGSQFTAQDEAAKRIVRDLRAEYFAPLASPASAR